MNQFHLLFHTEIYISKSLDPFALRHWRIIFQSTLHPLCFCIFCNFCINGVRTGAVRFDGFLKFDICLRQRVLVGKLISGGQGPLDAGRSMFTIALGCWHLDILLLFAPVLNDNCIPPRVTRPYWPLPLWLYAFAHTTRPTMWTTIVLSRASHGHC